MMRRVYLLIVRFSDFYWSGEIWFFEYNVHEACSTQESEKFVFICLGALNSS